MTSRWDDEELLGELREALARQRDVPDRALEIGRMAFGWRDVDGELERLTAVYDSSLHETAGVRGDGASAPRVLVFESDELTLEVEVGASTLVCHVVPALPGRLLAQTREGGEREGEADDGGFYLVPRPAGSPVRLRWQGEEGRLVTDWFPI